MHAAAIVAPHAPYQRRQHPLPPAALMPSVEIAVEVAGPSRLADQHRQPENAPRLLEKPVDQPRLLLRRQILAPQLIEVAVFDDAARGQVAAGERVADAESEEIVLKPGRLADEARAVRRGQSL